MLFPVLYNNNPTNSLSKFVTSIIESSLTTYMPYPILSAGDVNCQHSKCSYKPSHPNFRSNQIADCIQRHHITVVNTPNALNFTFKQGKHTTWIDLICAYLSSPSRLNDMGIITDHRAFVITPQLSPAFSISTITRPRFHISDFRLPTSILTHDISTPFSVDKLAKKLPRYPLRFHPAKQSISLSNSHIAKLRCKIKRIRRRVSTQSNQFLHTLRKLSRVVDTAYH
jgi:hypothetical protein